MNSSKRLTANIIMFIALITLGAAATFTIIDGINSFESTTTSSQTSGNRRQMNNGGMPQMNGEMPEMNGEAPQMDGENTPPEMGDGNTSPETQNNQNNNNQSGRPSRRSDTETETNETSSFQLTTAETETETETQTEPENTEIMPSEESVAPVQSTTDSNHILINYLLVGAEFFAMGAIVTYLILSRLNSYSPKEVLTK